MKGLREKFHSKKGFTLVEMLIVVAIIAILIAISIPLVNNALEKARHATDDANFRAAAGLGTIMYLTDPPSAETEYYYYTNNASQGKLFTTGDTTTGYTKYTSQCTEPKPSDPNKNSATGTFKGQNIKVTIKTDGDVTVEWAT